ncbi:MAG: TIGR02206 family membrane protein [Clostridia bacterium]|nr:TIGR02206 family membrane protein [Clostridia bacterium]
MRTTVNFFSEGFFGYSDKQDFFFGSIWHILPIVLMIIVIILIYKYRKKIKNFKYERSVRFILAFVMLMVEMSFFWRLLYVGNQGEADTMLTYLPFQLCQWGLIVCVFTITSKNKKLFSINYYITLLFASIALIYPLVIKNAGPRYYRYYQFWLEHILPIISVFYLMFVHDMRPEKKGILYTFVVTVPLTIVALIANSNIKGARYLYLTLDIKILPENMILRALILFILVLCVFYLMYLPFDKKNKQIKTEQKEEV